MHGVWQSLVPLDGAMCGGLNKDFEGLRRGDSLLIGMHGCYTNSDLKRARELEESQEARPYPLDY